SSNIAILLSLPSKLSEKYLSDKFKQKYNVIDSNEKAAKYLVSFFLNKSNECFYLVMLDVAGKVIETVLVQEGTIDRVHFYPRNIIKLIFKYEAASVILAHNHPSGNLNPSGDDIIITREILNALKIINVTLFDHIIISGPNFYSFSNASLL
ncbi:MAG: JAB domain-containing protein, partial [Defluviitaleaceae bacterium]|nr:JAB domain-containing protein [Defluviitaleaceae bacterium]